MSYTTATAVGIVLAAVLDLVILRTRLLTTRRWWAAYAIIVFFQLVTNGWLTGRRIVTYDPEAIIGSGGVAFLGDGRIAWAPVEDLGFGFALVLATCALWVRLGRPGRRAARGSAAWGSAAPAAQHPGDGGGPRRP